MAGKDNLIPFSERSKEEAREYGAKGGRASGVARRRKRSLKEAADLFLSLPVYDGRTRNAILRRGVDPEDIDNQMAIIVGLSREAATGDARAAKTLFEILGESVPEIVTAESNLLEAILRASEVTVDTDDIPELEQAAADRHDMVEPAELKKP